MRKKAETETEQSEKIIVDEFKNIKTIDAGNVYTKIHTFKLESSTMLKNIGFDPKRPVLTTVDHCHFFHTYDSYGKKMTQTNSVGGHYHEVNVVNSNGEFHLEISPPKVRKGSQEAIKTDSHTHKYTYIKSEEVKVRQLSAEVARLISGMQQNYRDS